MSAVETHPFGYYGVDHPWRQIRLLCGECVEIRKNQGESVRFLDPVAQNDPHLDCADCGREWLGDGVPL